MNANSKPIRLAGAALTAAIDDKWPTATRYVQRINDECGPDALPYILMGWIDTLADHATDGQPIHSIGGVTGMNYDTGSITDEVPPRVEWAQKVVKARAELDEHTFIELVNELARIPDARERGSYVGAVLETAALSIRGLPRGYAQMGGR
jgi:hypothetical protein